MACTCVPAQLQPVLDASEKSAGVGEAPGVVLVDIPCCLSSSREVSVVGDRRSGSSRPWTSCEQLDGEFDVTNSASSALDLAVSESAAG